MPDLLVVSRAMTPLMRQTLEPHFTIHALFDQPDREAWLTAHGARIDMVLTDGHWGLRPEVGRYLANLRMVSCFGVGYDNIDAAELAAVLPVAVAPVSVAVLRRVRRAGCRASAAACRATTSASFASASS